jgi:hypothetical protein
VFTVLKGDAGAVVRRGMGLWGPEKSVVAFERL